MNYARTSKTFGYNFQGSLYKNFHFIKKVQQCTGHEMNCLNLNNIYNEYLSSKINEDFEKN